MQNELIQSRFSQLSTPLVADACVRLSIPFDVLDSSIGPLFPFEKVAGRARPVRHQGSVDVFFEAFEQAEPGDVLVIDNEGRLDEGCIGDLTVLEATTCGIAAIVVWGAVRDTAELREIGMPILCLGRCPAGPLGVRQGEVRPCRVGSVEVDRSDIVFADEDGLLVVDGTRLEEILEVATRIAEVERDQARRVREGVTLRDQMQFSTYLEERSVRPGYTFREHLRKMGAAIEE